MKAQKYWFGYIRLGNKLLEILELKRKAEILK